MRLELQRDTEPDHLLLLEHEPVYTRGRRAEPAELPMGEDWYRAQGIEVVRLRSRRRGDLSRAGAARGLPDHAHREGPRVRGRTGADDHPALADEGIEAGVRDGLTGVWAPKGKIGSIGVHVSSGVTRHGFAVNVDNDLQPFEWIVPCGMEGAQMSSIYKETGRVGRMDAFRDAVIERFCEVFDREPQVVVSTAG